MAYDINLDWRKPVLSGSGTKDDPYVYGDVIPMNLDAVMTWVKANSSDCCGSSANQRLQIHFTVEASRDAAQSAIEAYWNALDSSSSEATSYQTAAQIKAASDATSAAALASATSKLVALGLSDAEIAALSGK